MQGEIEQVKVNIALWKQRNLKILSESKEGREHAQKYRDKDQVYRNDKIPFHLFGPGVYLVCNDDEYHQYNTREIDHGVEASQRSYVKNIQGSDDQVYDYEFAEHECWMDSYFMVW